MVTPVAEMTYNVFGGTLNPAQPNPILRLQGDNGVDCEQYAKLRCI